ncbi:MAG: putative pyridoxal phosphate-dependent enzyme [Paracoccaceae bacterium]
MDDVMSKGIYDSLGVTELVNAAGPYTAIGGSRMSDKTLAAMSEAAQNYVDTRDLQRAVHQRIADLTHNQAAYVSNGAACGLMLCTAAAVSMKLGKSFELLKREDIADCEVAILRAHRNPYDWAFHFAGVSLHEIGYPNYLQIPDKARLIEEIGPKTVAIYYAFGPAGGWLPEGAPAFEIVAEVAREKGIPLIVDAAAQLPPKSNLWEISNAGANAVLFSGGKDLCGPQSSGLIVGDKAFLEKVTEIGFPNYGLGRMFKVGREELVGLLSAIEQYLERDEDQLAQVAERVVELFCQALHGSSICKASRAFPNEAGQPVARVKIAPLTMNADELQATLLAGIPSVFAGVERGALYINPMTLAEDEVGIVLNRLQDIEKTTRSYSPDVL